MNTVVSESIDWAVSAQTENAKKMMSQYWIHCLSLWGEVQKYPQQWMLITKSYQLALLFFFSVVTSLSLLAFLPTSLFDTPLLSLSVSVESKTDLIFAEGVLDDLWKRNTGGSVYVQLISETETDSAADVNKTQHTMTFVSITSQTCKERIIEMSMDIFMQRKNCSTASVTFSGKTHLTKSMICICV